MIIALFVIIGFVAEKAYGQQPSPRPGQIDPETGICMRCGSDPCRCFGNSTVTKLIEIDLRSEVTGTVLLNGNGSGFSQMIGNTTITATNDNIISITANRAIKLLVRSVSGTEYTFSVRDSEGNIHPAAIAIRATGDYGSYQVNIRRNQPAQTTQPQVPQPRVPSENTFEVEQLSNNTLAISNYNGDIRDIIVPETLYGLNVTIISNFNGYNTGTGSLATYNDNKNWGKLRSQTLRSIVFPNSITRIGEAVFTSHIYIENVMPTPPVDGRPILRRDNSQSEPEVDRSYGLHRVTFGNSLRTIGNYTFYNNPYLTEITFPNSVAEIGIRAFMKCGLTNINIPSGIKKIGDDAFARNKIQSVTFPAGIEFIGSGAFSNNNIQTVSIPSGVQNIGTGIFAGNIITRATLPANLSNDVMQRWGFETNLINFYANQNRAAGTYVKNGPIWSKQ